ncbi:MAG TPA: hypothetical protein VFI24_27125 [Pyrinomonadaceae bacterium]|nr:hypothetical protein [Pyrinomonadaceae bacterium]
MPFRVGLLFHSLPARPFSPGPVAELLQKINTKTESIRVDLPLTLVTYVRTAEMAHYAQVLAGNEYQVESATFDEAGVSFGELDTMAEMPHPKHDEICDFNLGMDVLLGRCEVILVVCKDESKIPEIRNWLGLHHNSSVFLAIVPARRGQPRFLEINPLPEDIDGPSWLLALTECWETKDLRPYAAPISKRTVLGLIFPLLNSVILRERYETVKKRLPMAERCRRGMGLSETANKKLEPADRDSLEGVLATICPYFTSHDDLGRHYSNVFRTSCFLLPLLIVISTVLAVGAAISQSLHDLLHIAEGVLLLAAAGLFLRTKLAKHHHKWITNRLLAEFLRLVLLNQLFYTLPRLTLPAEEPELWINRSRMLLKHLRALPSIVLVTPKAELLSARISAIEDFVRYQSGWHKNFAAQHQTAARHLTRISTYAFVVTLCLCVLQLLISYYLEETVGSDRATILAHILMMLTLISATLAFVISLLSHQLGFEAIAERSRNAAERFDELVKAIKQSGHVADATQVYSWVNQCAETIVSEQHSWYRHIPLIRMHL